MYHAKDTGRDNFQFYTKTMNKMVSSQLVMQNNLSRALEKKEFELFYQPIINIETGRISSVESLIRWTNSELGPVSPVEFIPLAEEMGIIVPIGQWVLQTACECALKWQQIGIPAIDVAINVSGRQMQKDNIVSAFSEVLSQYDIDNKNIVLELTESTLMENTESALHKLDQFRAMGLKLAIDDFGTGYSSLSYLKRMPVNKLKIDKAFVNDIGIKRDDEAIILAVIALCKNLKLKVVAEGVETRRQLEFLKRYQCDEVQGYFFSKPLNEADCTRLLKENYGLLDN